MHISEINIYPIKSLKGISMDTALVEERGLQHDRRWMLTDMAGKFLTQREFPRMSTIEVGVGIGDDNLYVTAESYGTMELPMTPDTSSVQSVTIWQSVCDAVVYGGVVNEWFSDVLGAECRLVHMPESSRRNVNPRFDRGDEVVSFADGYPLMMIGEASLAELNSRLETPLPMNRFRPNLVVSGSEAFAEDNWQRIKIGDVEFRSTKPCERCVITTVDQSKGEFAGKEPLKTLASYRSAKDVMPDRLDTLGLSQGAVLFGQNFMAEDSGAVINGGDVVAFVETFCV